MPIPAVSLKDLMDWIDSETQTIQLEHSDRNAQNALKVKSDFVWIPRFTTAGFPASMVAKGFLNGVNLGGFAIAKYPASHPLATMTSKGGDDSDGWGGTYAAMSLPLKCVWTYVNWDEAILACEAMNQKTANGLAVDDIATGTASGNGTGNTLVDTSGIKTKLTGDNLEIVSGGITYYRRIVTADPYQNIITFYPGLPYGLVTTLAGGNNNLRYTRKASQTNYISVQYVDGGSNGTMTAVRSGAGTVGDPYLITITFFGDDNLASTVITKIRADANCNAVVHVANAPGNNGTGAITAMNATPLAQLVTLQNDAYTIKKFTLWGLYEWATVKYLCAMRYAINKMPYPKGNSNYGKDDADADVFSSYGRPDPDYTASSYTGGRAKVLTGTGPNSWYHNGKPDGIWGLKGNIWQCCKAKVGTQADYVIDAGFPGEGHVFPSSNNYWASMAISGDCGIPDLALLSGVNGSPDVDFNRNYYVKGTGDVVVNVIDNWGHGMYAGVFGLSIAITKSSRVTHAGFRAVA